MFGKLDSSGVMGIAAALTLSSCAAPLDPVVPLDPHGQGFSQVLEANEGTSSPHASGGAFYPLTLGNHWEYARTFTVQVFPTDGPPSPTLMSLATLDKDLIGTEQRFGRVYVVQLETYREEQGEFQIRFLYRQDRGGLYNADPGPLSGKTTTRGRERNTIEALADRSTRIDPTLRSHRQSILRLLEKHELVRALALSGRAPELDRPRPGPLPGEIALLRYPLHTHRQWIVREDPLFVYTVEGQEVLDLPAGRFNGWRIEIDLPDLFGPNDRAHVWYGRDGQLKLAAHFEGEATDEAGNVVGRARERRGGGAERSRAGQTGPPSTSCV